MFPGSRSNEDSVRLATHRPFVPCCRAARVASRDGGFGQRCDSTRSPGTWTEDQRNVIRILDVYRFDGGTNSNRSNLENEAS